VISEECIRFEDSTVLSVVDISRVWRPIATIRHSPVRAGIWLPRDHRSDFNVKH